MRIDWIISPWRPAERVCLRSHPATVGDEFSISFYFSLTFWLVVRVKTKVKEWKSLITLQHFAIGIDDYGWSLWTQFFSIGYRLSKYTCANRLKLRNHLTSQVDFSHGNWMLHRSPSECRLPFLSESRGIMDEIWCLDFGGEHRSSKTIPFKSRRQTTENSTELIFIKWR